MKTIINLGTDTWGSIEYGNDDSDKRLDIEEIIEIAANRLQEKKHSKMPNAKIIIIGEDSNSKAYILNTKNLEEDEWDAVDMVKFVFSSCQPRMDRKRLRKLSLEHIEHHKIKHVYVYDLNKMGSIKITDFEIMAAENHSYGQPNLKRYRLFPHYINIEPGQLYAFMHELRKCNMLKMGRGTKRAELYDRLRNLYRKYTKLQLF